MARLDVYLENTKQQQSAGGLSKVSGLVLFFLFAVSLVVAGSTRNVYAISVAAVLGCVFAVVALPSWIRSFQRAREHMVVQSALKAEERRHHGPAGLLVHQHLSKIKDLATKAELLSEGVAELLVALGKAEAAERKELQKKVEHDVWYAKSLLKEAGVSLKQANAVKAGLVAKRRYSDQKVLQYVTERLADTETKLGASWKRVVAVSDSYWERGRGRVAADEPS